MLADEPILDFGRLETFTCTVKDFDRNELASLPPSYLKVRDEHGMWMPVCLYFGLPANVILAANILLMETSRSMPALTGWLFRR